MKKILKYLFLALFINFNVTSIQAKPDGLPRENIVAMLSGNYLLSGETFYFSVLVSNNADLPGKQISSIVYCEIRDADNRSLKRQKILLENGSGAGAMTLPDSLSSGTYYFIAYTNWLKNFGPESFFTNEIVVANPGDYKPSDNKTDLTSLSNKNKTGSGNENLRIELAKNEYKTGSKISVDFILPANIDSAKVSVAVKKKEPATGRKIWRLAENLPGPETIEYLPDYEGFVFSGFVRDKDSNQPLASQDIYLSFPGEYIDIKHTTTNEDGNFRFLLDSEYGEKDMVFLLESENAGIWLEEIFFDGNINFSSRQHSISQNSLINYFTEKFVNRQLQQKFNQSLNVKASTSESNDFCFYDYPYQVLRMEDYIQLDSLHEYFYELIPIVHLNRNEDAYKMFLTDPENNYPIGEHPAIFIDGVYYPFPGGLLQTDASLIERIEIIPKKYFYRDMSFDGIVSVFTKDENFMSVPVQPNMVRIFYKLTENKIENGILNLDERLISGKNHIPDLRWLIYWNPAVSIEKETSAQIDFFASDVKGEFEITVAGITDGGEVIQASQIINVE